MDLTIYSLLNLAVIALEVYLATRKSRAAGLVLPVLWFGFTLFAVVMTVIGSVTHYGAAPTVDASYLLSAVLTLVTLNFPTMMLLGIYILCRKQRKNNLDKMRVQDL